MSKRGQKSGADAWVLILLITLAMITFVLFMPAQERDRVFDSDFTTPSGSSDGPSTSYGVSGETLLDKQVGRLEFYPQGPIEHPIPSVHLFKETRSEVIEQLNPFTVERAAFSGSPVDFAFQVPNLNQADNILLLLDVGQRQGTLSVFLNGQKVADLAAGRGSVAPLSLKKHLLQEQNTLTFDLSSPGWKIWQLNVWEITGARVVADVRDPAKQQADLTFILSPVEQRNMLASKLRFSASCDPFNMGPLEILVNSQSVYRAVPDCETINLINVDPSVYKEGQNSLRLRAQEGEVRLDSMQILTDLKDVKSFVEYFEVEDDLYDSVVTGGRDIFVEVEFVDDGKPKEALLNVNQRVVRIDQLEPFFARNINEWVEPGFRNYVELTPESPLNIVGVRVVTR